MTRAVSRFKNDNMTDRYGPPRCVGLCRYCWRPIWTDLGSDRKLIRAAVDGDQCQSCETWIKRHPGQDPRDRTGAAAERVPAERPEADPGWRELSACAGLPSEPFDPELDDDDPVRQAQTDVERGKIWDARRYAATVCAGCPVREQCRRVADAHAYEGIWGGRFYSRTSWLDLDTGERGDTMYARQRDRDRHARRTARGIAASGPAA